MPSRNHHKTSPRISKTSSDNHQTMKIAQDKSDCTCLSSPFSSYRTHERFGRQSIRDPSVSHGHKPSMKRKSPRRRDGENIQKQLHLNLLLTPKPSWYSSPSPLNNYSAMFRELPSISKQHLATIQSFNDSKDSMPSKKIFLQQQDHSLSSSMLLELECEIKQIQLDTLRRFKEMHNQLAEQARQIQELQIENETFRKAVMQNQLLL